MRRAAGEVHAAAPDFDEEEDIQTLEPNGIDAEKVHGDQAVGLSTEELPPRGAASRARWTELVLVQDLPDGGRRDDDAETLQFAHDALITPARVLACQPDDHARTSRLIGGRPARRGYVHRFATRRRCQSSRVVGVTRNDDHLTRGRSRLAAVRNKRSAPRNVGRWTCRRSTASSCRSTTISSSLNSGDRTEER